MRFHRNKNGRIVGKNEEGEYNKDNDVSMCVKYHDELRFALGVATVEMLDGEFEGRRCEMIDYTRKGVISGAEEEKRIKDKIQQVKTLTGNQKPWVITNAPPGYNANDIWEHDPVNKLKQINKTAAENLEREKGIRNVP